MNALQYHKEMQQGHPPEVDDLELDSSSGRGPTSSSDEAQNTPSRPLQRVATYLQPSIPLLERIRHFTFAWYTVTYGSSPSFHDGWTHTPPYLG